MPENVSNKLLMHVKTMLMQGKGKSKYSISIDGGSFRSEKFLIQMKTIFEFFGLNQ